MGGPKDNLFHYLRGTVTTCRTGVGGAGGGGGGVEALSNGTRDKLAAQLCR